MGRDGIQTKPVWDAQVNDNLIKALEESRSATGNLLHLDSPPPRTTSAADDMQRLSLQGNRLSSTGTGSTLTSMNDGTSQVVLFHVDRALLT